MLNNQDNSRAQNSGCVSRLPFSLTNTLIAALPQFQAHIQEK